MANNKSDGLGNKPIIVIVGLIASCIAIFAFLTGKQSIFDVISTLFEKPDFISTPIFIVNTLTPTNQLEPSVIPDTPTQIVLGPTTAPMVIDSSNAGVSIAIQDLSSSAASAQGNIRIQFLAGNVPLRNVYIYFHNATQDISGKWTLIKGVTRDGLMVAGKTNENGIVEDTLEPGNYAAFNEDYSANWNQLNGTWGVKAFYFDYKDPMQTILFPIQAGKLTDIKVSLAHLEIGVVDKNGNAVKDRLVYLFCHDVDVADNKIPVDCGDGENVTKTDYTGLTSYNLGVGTYVIEIVSDGYEKDFYFYDVSVKPGENRRDILTINK